eukprot:3932305-Rhodomonas_salina.4
MAKGGQRKIIHHVGHQTWMLLACLGKEGSGFRVPFSVFTDQSSGFEVLGRRVVPSSFRMSGFGLRAVVSVPNARAALCKPTAVTFPYFASDLHTFDVRVAHACIEEDRVGSGSSRRSRQIDGTMIVWTVANCPRILTLR